ncbi:MAG TPA: SGNH/GDSL hydrolase family protein [Caulobacteraceae bacterium]|nr:SGNH/GDSL hydrolase family protein [Caulobacteraceae bacterium]
MSRINIFARGNLDVRDTLHSLRIGGELTWNGVNEVLRDVHPDAVVRVRHETGTRSDALLAADGRIPPELGALEVSFAPYPLENQFAPALFEAQADAFVLSIQPELMTCLVRHKREGYLLFPGEWADWPLDKQAWLKANFDDAGLIDIEAALANFGAIVDRLRARSEAPILIYNLSYVVPGEQVHNHQGLEDLLSTRIKRLNLGLIELSQSKGVSIIDVDAIIARGGADRLKIDAIHLTTEACRRVAEEVVRVLDELDVFAQASEAA